MVINYTSFGLRHSPYINYLCRTPSIAAVENKHFMPQSWVKVAVVATIQIDNGHKAYRKGVR